MRFCYPYRYIACIFDCYSVLFLSFLGINAACSWRFRGCYFRQSSQTSMFHQAFGVMENIFFVCFGGHISTFISGIFKVKSDLIY